MSDVTVVVPAAPALELVWQPMTAAHAISSVPWFLAIVLCLTLGLAPYSPPHIVEKLQMLVQGRLVRPLDWFDLVLHTVPWLLLLAKAGVAIGARGR